MANQSEPRIIGALEQVSFPQFDINNITAKIDTGAYTGALHCTKIHEETTDSGEILHFSPFDHPEIVETTSRYFVKSVRSSNGTLQKRFFIDTEIIIRGENFPIILSLADRSEMKWPVLIGRRFLRAERFIVDVSKFNK